VGPELQKDLVSNAQAAEAAQTRPAPREPHEAIRHQTAYTMLSFYTSLSLTPAVRSRVASVVAHRFWQFFLKKKHAIVRGARGGCFFDTLTAVLLSRLLCLALVLSAALLLSQFRPPWLPASPVLYVQCLRPPTPSPVARHFATAFIYASRALSGGVVCTRGGMRWL